MVSCLVKNCKSYRNRNKHKQGVTYHSVPCDPERSEIWRRILALHRNDENYIVKPNVRICSLHFSEDDFSITKTGRRSLKKSAIPSLKNDVVTEAVQSKTPSGSSNKEKERIKEEELNTPSRSTVEDDNLMDVDIGDLDSIFDSPRTVKLKKTITSLKKIKIKHIKQIKRLQRSNIRIKKKMGILLSTITELREKLSNKS